MKILSEHDLRPEDSLRFTFEGAMDPSHPALPRGRTASFLKDTGLRERHVAEGDGAL